MSDLAFAKSVEELVEQNRQLGAERERIRVVKLIRQLFAQAERQGLPPPGPDRLALAILRRPEGMT